MRNLPFLICLCALVGSAGAAPFEHVEPLAPYQPPENHSSVIHLAGDRHMQALVAAWSEGFKQVAPELSTEATLIGNGTGMPMLYLGLADIALFGRETIVTDNDGFNHVLAYRQLRIEFGSGSLATPGHAPAMAVLVHPDNPLAQLTLEQLDAIFSYRRFRGAPQAILTWGQLGLTGEWANQPIHLYGDSTESMTGLYFAHTVLGDSRQMNWDHYSELVDVFNSDGSVTESAERCAEAVRHDRYGIALSTLRYASHGLHALALAAKDGASAVLPTNETVVGRQYPLTRPIFLCVNVRPKQPLDPKVRHFLEYILSDDGQALLAAKGGYLPLSAKDLATQRAKLEAAPAK